MAAAAAAAGAALVHDGAISAGRHLQECMRQSGGSSRSVQGARCKVQANEAKQELQRLQRARRVGQYGFALEFIVVVHPSSAHEGYAVMFAGSPPARASCRRYRLVGSSARTSGVRSNPLLRALAAGSHLGSDAARCAASSAATIGLAVPAAAIARGQVRQLVPLGLGLFMLQARVLCRLRLPCGKPGGMLGMVRWPLRRPEVRGVQSVQRAQGVRAGRPSRREDRGLRVVVLDVLFV